MRWCACSRAWLSSSLCTKRCRWRASAAGAAPNNTSCKLSDKRENRFLRTCATSSCCVGAHAHSMAKARSTACSKESNELVANKTHQRNQQQLAPKSTETCTALHLARSRQQLPDSSCNRLVFRTPSFNSLLPQRNRHNLHTTNKTSRLKSSNATKKQHH